MVKICQFSQCSVLIGLALCISVGPKQALSMVVIKRGCSYETSVKGYDCMKLDLTDIPDDLGSSTEVLDASLNRIRTLTNNSFKNYPYLKKLYLNDNMIQTIESGTFDSLTYLHTLDLSVNSLVEVPVAILHIQTLRSLFLGKNTLLDATNLFNKAAPISAPLQHLDLSFTLLPQLPNFERMMDLIHLNITGDHITNVSKSSFVPLCNLKVFTNINLTMEYSTACDCFQISSWFQALNVRSNPEFEPRCDFAAGKCQDDVEPTAMELATHEKCISEFNSREAAKTMLKTITIVFATIGGILLTCGLCYLYYRWQSFSEDDENKNIKNDLKSEKVSDQLLTKNNEYINS